MPTLEMSRYGIDITEWSTEGLSNRFARLILIIAIERSHGGQNRDCQQRSNDRPLSLSHNPTTHQDQNHPLSFSSNRYPFITNMKLTIPEMTPLSNNGFPMFKPYGEQWCFVADAGGGKITCRPMGNCSTCYRMCPITHVCQDNGHPPALSAPLAVMFGTDYPSGKSTRVYILHPSIAATMFKQDPKQGTVSEPIGEARRPSWTLGDNDLPFLLNHLQILPRLNLDGLTQEERNFEEHRMHMRTILHAIHTNCFPQEVLDIIKGVFTWIGKETEDGEPTMV